MERLMERLKQTDGASLILTKKTVQWLIDNTVVHVFNPITFNGYQRKLDRNHCSKIVDYIRKGFFMPSAIVCATNGDYSEDTKLRIVDGQHRIEAFRMLKEKYAVEYRDIESFELPVIVMENVSESSEIDTFITINKTSKKVDTSLAFVLKNKINKYNSSGDLTMPKSEFLSVEIAQVLNNLESPKTIWYDRILFEGSIKQSAQYISLNAFVRATRRLLSTLCKNRIISLNWDNQSDTDDTVQNCVDFIKKVYDIIQMKWPMLFDGYYENSSIIQGAIGYSAILKVMTELLKDDTIQSFEQLVFEFENVINCTEIQWQKWAPNGEYARYSSEAGYSIIAKEILGPHYY